MLNLPINNAQRTRSYACLLLLGAIAGTPAIAQELNDEALNELAMRGFWEAEHAEYGIWSWNSDSTVCLRIGNKDSDCADTGMYKISDHILCYELTWWGDSVGERKGCFTVRPLGEDRYETVFHGTTMASRMFAFKVLE